MTEEEGPVSSPMPASPMPAVEKKDPAKSAQIITFIFGILSLVAGVVVLITTLNSQGIEETIRMGLFWLGWGFLLVEIILTFVFSSRKYKPSKFIGIAGFCGLAAAILMLISAFLRH